MRRERFIIQKFRLPGHVIKWSSLVCLLFPKNSVEHFFESKLKRKKPESQVKNLLYAKMTR